MPLTHNNEFLYTLDHLKRFLSNQLNQPTQRINSTATVDATYREMAALVQDWRRMGATVVNMEAASFYAAASVCGLHALWIGHDSDILVGDWKDWDVDRGMMNDGTVRNCLTVIHGIIEKGERIDRSCGR